MRPFTTSSIIKAHRGTTHQYIHRDTQDWSKQPCARKGWRPYRKQPGHIAQLIGLQSVDEGVLLAEALLKQLLVGAVDVAEALAQMTIVAAI